MVAVVILQRVFSRMSCFDENKISNSKSFIILRSGERVTSFTKNNNANFSSENGKMKLSGKSTF